MFHRRVDGDAPGREDHLVSSPASHCQWRPKAAEEPVEHRVALPFLTFPASPYI